MIKTIGFLGCGNMGGAIARAVCKAADPPVSYTHLTLPTNSLV